jgi:hypothetical protein
MKEKYYKINNNYYAIVLENEFENRIRFGGTRECINISVYKDDTIPQINGISYDKRCNKTESMIPGSGTIDMIKSAIKFSKSLYPDNCKSFMFKDMSNINCKKNIKVPLYYYYLSKYGKTWYQSKLNARPEFKQHIKFIEESLIKLNDPKEKVNYKTFCTLYLRNLDSKIKNLQDEFKDLYNESNTYHEFLNKIIDTYDCGILNIWFNKLWSNLCQFQFHEYYWIIKEKTILSWLEAEEIEIKSKRTKPKFTMVAGGVKIEEFFPYGKYNIKKFED